MINWITSLACTDDEQIDTDTDIDENGDEVEDQGKLVTSFKISDIFRNLFFYLLNWKIFSLKIPMLFYLSLFLVLGKFPGNFFPFPGKMKTRLQ